MPLLTQLVEKFSTEGGLLGLIILLLLSIVFFVVYTLTRVHIQFLAALRVSLHNEDHSLGELKKVIYKNSLLPDRRKGVRDVEQPK